MILTFAGFRNIPKHMRLYTCQSREKEDLVTGCDKVNKPIWSEYFIN